MDLELKAKLMVLIKAYEAYMEKNLTSELREAQKWTQASKKRIK